MAQTNEARAAAGLEKAISTIGLNLSMVAYIIARKGEAIEHQFFNLVIAYLNEIASHADEELSQSDSAYRRSIAAKRMLDGLARFK